MRLWQMLGKEKIEEKESKKDVTGREDRVETKCLMSRKKPNEKGSFIISPGENLKSSHVLKLITNVMTIIILQIFQLASY